MQENTGWIRYAMIVMVWVTAPASARAYIDPGNGAYMVQALFAVIGAALFYLRHPIQSLKALGNWLIGKFATFRNRPSKDVVVPDAVSGERTTDVQNH